MRRTVSLPALLLVSLLAVGCSKPAPVEPVQKTEDTLRVEEAAGKGDKEAEYALGVLYLKGEGGEMLDKAKAIEQFTKAAEQGLDNAEYTLGYLYAKGDGLSADRQKAMDWFAKAANQGHAEAIYRLGQMYSASGAGLKPDFVQAYSWLSLVADGDTRAQQLVSSIAMHMSPDELTKAQTSAEQLGRKLNMSSVFHEEQSASGSSK